MNSSLSELADRVNAWCLEHHIAPANGQASEALTLRTLRYYRTVGLLDAPLAGKGKSYGQRHFLQAVAVRILQSQGQPLTRIQSLLFGRSDEELETIAQHATEWATHAPPSPPSPSLSLPFSQAESWEMVPLTEQFLLISRGGASLPAATLERLRAVLEDAEKPLTIL